MGGWNIIKCLHENTSGHSPRHRASCVQWWPKISSPTRTRTSPGAQEAVQTKVLHLDIHHKSFHQSMFSGCHSSSLCWSLGCRETTNVQRGDQLCVNKHRDRSPKLAPLGAHTMPTARKKLLHVNMRRRFQDTLTRPVRKPRDQDTTRQKQNAKCEGNLGGACF